MANWNKKLDISETFKRVKINEIPLKELVDEIISKLELIKYTENDSPYFERLNEELEEIIFEFKDFSQSDDVEDVDAFDDILNTLYDFGDQTIAGFDNFFNHVKAMWIKTF